MANFKNQYGQTTNLEEQQALMADGIKAILKRRDKTQWAKILAEEYGILKTGKRRVKYLFLYKVAAAAACIAFIFVIGQNIMTSTISPEQQALKYLHESHITHPGVLKGMSMDDQSIRQLAISSFDNGNYIEAIKHFNSLRSLSAEDQFFLGVSHVYEQQYEEAITLLEELDLSSSNYKQEINWFLGLSYHLNQNLESAKVYLAKIKKDDWKYTEANKILKGII